MFNKKEWSRQYKIKNRERINAVRRAWKKRNPDKVRAENARRKPTWLDPQYRTKKRAYDYMRRNELRFGGNYENVLVRDGYRCSVCGSEEKLQVHHKDHNGRNSPNPNNSPGNLVTLCATCHAIHHHTINSWSRKYPRCRTCSSSELPHYSLGYCQPCYWIQVAKPKRVSAP